MSTNFATTEGTERFSTKYPTAASAYFRKVEGLELSSIGVGTYLGNPDAATDQSYSDAITRFVELGGNVIDTAANYRFQRSERSIGEALKNLSAKGFSREELFISTKGGYLPFDGEPPRDVRAYFEETFVKTGIAGFDDLVAGSHCMTPNYLESQIDQSLRNMGIGTIDLFYIHNPESQLSEVPTAQFEVRLAKAFERLEECRSNGKIQFYGVATWNGFRISPQQVGYHSLEKMIRIAKQIGGDGHGFKFIQLPYNLAMPEAYVSENQQCNGKALSTIGAAQELGVTVMCSASILQGRLAGGLPPNVIDAMGDQETDAQNSIQFVRSTPGVATALVGMSRTAHVEENMRLVNVEPASQTEFNSLFGQ
jgi:aryl-alcohol dehydrogenase-like predicted oxidoreductase